MNKKEKIEKRFTDIADEAGKNLLVTYPEKANEAVFGKVHDYMSAYLEKKAGDDVNLPKLEQTIANEVGEQQAKELQRLAKKAVETAIDDILGKGI